MRGGSAIQNTSVEIMCPTVPVDYNCSFQAYNKTLSLVWQITYIREPTVTITYNRTFSLNNIVQFSSGIQASVTKYRANRYIESILSVEFPPGSSGASVRCAVSTIPQSQLDVIIYEGTYVPILTYSELVVATIPFQPRILMNIILAVRLQMHGSL